MSYLRIKNIRNFFCMSFALLAVLLVNAGAAQAREDADGNTFSYMHISADWPTVDNNDINDQLEAYAENVVSQFLTDNISDIRELVQEYGLGHFFPFELMLSFDQVENQAGYLSVIWNSWYYLGGAHGSSILESSNYHQPSGTKITIENLFPNLQAGLSLLSSLARPKLQRQLGEDAIEDMLAPGIEPTVDNFKVFALTDEGLRIYFQPYQVAPYSAGMPTIDISLKELGTLVNKAFWGK